METALLQIGAFLVFVGGFILWFQRKANEAPMPPHVKKMRQSNNPPPRWTVWF